MEFIRNALNLHDKSYHRVHGIKITTDQCANSIGERWTTYFDKFWWSTHRLVHLPVIMGLVPISIQYFPSVFGKYLKAIMSACRHLKAIIRETGPLSHLLWLVTGLLAVSFVQPSSGERGMGWGGLLIKRKFALLYCESVQILWLMQFRFCNVISTLAISKCSSKATDLIKSESRENKTIIHCVGIVGCHLYSVLSFVC